MTVKLEPLRRKLLIGIALSVILPAFVSGCYADRGEEIPTTASGEDCGSFVFPGFTGTPTTNASWDYIQTNIFGGRGHCTNCHTGTAGAGPSGLALDYDKYDFVVTNQLMSGYAGNDLAIIRLEGMQLPLQEDQHVQRRSDGRRTWLKNATDLFPLEQCGHPPDRRLDR